MNTEPSERGNIPDSKQDDLFLRWWKSQSLDGEPERSRLIARVAFKAGVLAAASSSLAHYFVPSTTPDKCGVGGCELNVLAHPETPKYNLPAEPLQPTGEQESRRLTPEQLTDIEKFQRQRRKSPVPADAWLYVAEIDRLLAHVAHLTAIWCVCGHAKSDHRFYSDHDECWKCPGTEPPESCSEFRPVATPPTTPSDAAMRAAEDGWFDLVLRYMRGDPALTDIPYSQDSVFAEFLRLWDAQTPHFRSVVGAIFRAAPKFTAATTSPETPVGGETLEFRTTKEAMEYAHRNKIPTVIPVVATGDDEGERMRAAFQDAKDSLDPEGKWTAGDVSNFSALFFAGWNAHASGSSSNKEAIHLSITPFYAICGNGGRDARTTQVPAHVTCDTCAEYWAKFITNYFYGGEITMDDVTRLVLEANSETSTLKKGQTVHVDGIPYELLDDVAAFSATDAAALRTPVEGK